MSHERQRAVPDADRQRAGESLVNRPAAAAAAEAALSLQRAAGNRAAARVLQRFPAATDVESFWSELVSELKDEGRTTEDLDCFQASMRVAAIGGSKARERKLKPERSRLNGPLYRISQHDERATPEEARAAHGRGWRVRDRVVWLGRGEYLRVYTGGAGGAAPTATYYPLLPGMIIYTAENAGWADKASGTYNWFKRHAAVYRGGGWVRDNFDAQPRNIMQGHAEEDEWGAWHRPKRPKKDDPQFLTTLAVYDPFYAYRSDAEVRWLSGGARSAMSAVFGRSTP